MAFGRNLPTETPRVGLGAAESDLEGAEVPDAVPIAEGGLELGAVDVVSELGVVLAAPPRPPRPLTPRPRALPVPRAGGVPSGMVIDS